MFGRSLFPAFPLLRLLDPFPFPFHLSLPLPLFSGDLSRARAGGRGRGDEVWSGQAVRPNVARGRVKP